MQKTKKSMLFVFLALAFVLTLMVGLFLVNHTSVAKAEETDSTETLNYTLVTNEDGESSYKVAVRPILKSSVTFIRIPETFNGLPFTEIKLLDFRVNV